MIIIVDKIKILFMKIQIQKKRNQVRRLLKEQPINNLERKNENRYINNNESIYEFNNYYVYTMSDQAVCTQAPPTPLILLSAVLLNNLALTTKGI